MKHLRQRGIVLYPPQLDKIDDAGQPPRMAGDVLLAGGHSRMVGKRGIDQQIRVDRFHAASYQPRSSISKSARSSCVGRFIASFFSRAACTWHPWQRLYQNAFLATDQLDLIVDGKQLRGSYRSPYSSKLWRVTLHAYRVCLARQAWYLIARPEGELMPRTLRVVRFRRLQVLDGAASVPADFDLRTHLGDAWDIFRGEQSYDVEIRFAKEAAVQVTETRWHHTQRIKRHRDGSVTLLFRVDGLDEIVWWLLPWTGFFAEVIRPLELRQRLVEQLEEGLRMNHLAKR